MGRFLTTYVERNSLDKFINAFKSVAWLSYVINKRNGSTVYSFTQAQGVTDPKIQPVLNSANEIRFLYRKQSGERLRVNSKIEMYEALVPGSANILEHPLFCFLNNHYPEYWLYNPQSVEAQANKFPHQQSKLLLRLNARLSQKLISPLKHSIIEQLAEGNEIDGLAALLFLYLLCQRQYVRPSFFWKLEKFMFRIVIKMFCFNFDPKWAFQLIRAIRLKLDDIDNIASNIKTEIMSSKHKRRFKHIFFHRVTKTCYLSDLIKRSKSIYNA